jgi:hypothetical protein
MQLSKRVLIDISEDAVNSTGVQTDGLLLSGIVFPATMTGTAVTFDFSFDGSTWVDVVETDGTEVTYTVTAGSRYSLKTLSTRSPIVLLTMTPNFV